MGIVAGADAHLAVGRWTVWVCVVGIMHRNFVVIWPWFFAAEMDAAFCTAQWNSRIKKTSLRLVFAHAQSSIGHMVLLQFIQTLAIGLGLTAGQNVLALGIAAATTGRLLAALAAFVAPLALLLV